MEHFNPLDIPVVESPQAPGLGKVRVYFKKDGLLYKMDSTGMESQMEIAVRGFDPTLTMLNSSSITLQPGYIIKLNEAKPMAIETFPASNPFQPLPFGIVIEGGDPEQNVKIQYAGICTVAMDKAQVNIGDFIYNSATPGFATASDGGFTGALGRALTGKANGVAGNITALIGFFAHLG